MAVRHYLFVKLLDDIKVATGASIFSDYGDIAPLAWLKGSLENGNISFKTEEL
jgi:hypothetical protein